MRPRAFFPLVVAAALGCGSTDPQPATAELERLLAPRWVVLADPTSSLEPGWSFHPGAGFRTDCFVQDRVDTARSWQQYEGYRSSLREGGLALRALRWIGFRVELNRYRSVDLRTWGWHSRAAVNLRPNTNSPECFGAGSVPRYPAIGEVLAFDSLEITAMDRANRRLDLSVTPDRSQLIPSIDSLRWTLGDSNRVHARGTSLVVAFRATFWRVERHRSCVDTLSTLASALEQLCAADGIQLTVRVLADGAGYRAIIRDDERSGGRADTVRMALGDRHDLLVTHLRWARVFLEPSPAGQPYVQVRYEATHYRTWMVGSLAQLDPAIADSLPTVRPRGR